MQGKQKRGEVIMHPKRPGKANQMLEKLSPEGFVDREYNKCF
jgi:hypothetical protein